ncbi:MAG: hypothetical protein J7L31_06230 [Thermoplasmata archaeon]|nr:hypothetical protein [Thermoplasmata archaeon]
MRFLNDEKGRVPFAVLGVFLIIGSAITSGIITNLERENTKEITLPLEDYSVKYLIRCAEADIERALAYSFLEALDYLGKNPVLYSDPSKLPNPKIARDYADFNENKIYYPMDENDPDIIDEYWEIVKFNQNWARNMARVIFNKYLNATFKNNLYQNAGYTINIVDPEHNGAIDDWRDIKLESINMELERAHQVDLLISEDNRDYPVYWKASLNNFKIEICDLKSNEKFLHTINISILIPSRLPLLIALTETYQRSINGISPLMGLITVIGEIYTEARSLLQYANRYDWVANIVDDRWLQYLTNLGLITIQYLVFNSVDPLTLIYLILNINDLVSKKDVTDVDKYVTENAEDLIKEQLLNLVSLPFTADENVFKTVGKENEEGAKETVNNLEEKVDESIRKEKGRVAIADVARDILWKSETKYYYMNEKTGEIKSEDEFKGYKHGDYRLTTQNGDPTPEHLVGDVYTKGPLDELTENVQTEILEKVREIYSSSFSTSIEREEISDYYSPSISQGKWRYLSSEKWDLIDSNAQTTILQRGELPSSLPYSEVWKLNWKREEKWQHYEIVGYINETPIYDWVDYSITHFYTERVVFTLNAFNYDSNINGIFRGKDVFGSSPHDLVHDDNLEHLLHKYVNDNFTRIRDEFIDISLDKGKGKRGIYDEVTWKNNTAWDEMQGYGLSWLLGKDGEVVNALKEIIELIEKDNEIYSDISTFSSEGKMVSTLDDIEKERELLLQKFIENEERYIRGDYYMENGEYKSAGAEVILKMREWFVKRIEEALSQSKKNEIEDEINNRLKDYNANFDYNSYENNKKKYEGSVSQIGAIQFGQKMNLKGDWMESISLAISATPDYFKAAGENFLGGKKNYNDIAKEENWQFNVKNICLFGPTGLPILPPTPLTPWIVTINSWYIHVDGHWGEFKVLDGNDETIADSLFGHKAAMYCRYESFIYDDVCHPSLPSEDKRIGRCERLNFGFSTMSLGIVPPGKLPIGDLWPVGSGAPILEEHGVGN